MQTSGNSGLWKSTTRLVRSELLHFLSTAPLLPLTKVSPTVSQNHSMKKRSWNILGAIPPFCRAVSADPSLGARAAGCPLLHQGCSGDALLPFWDKTAAVAKKHQLKGFTFAQKEQTPPLLEQALLWLCAGLGLVLLFGTSNIFTQNGKNTKPESVAVAKNEEWTKMPWGTNTS